MKYKKNSLVILALVVFGLAVFFFARAKNKKPQNIVSGFIDTTKNLEEVRDAEEMALGNEKQKRITSGSDINLKSLVEDLSKSFCNELGAQSIDLTDSQNKNEIVGAFVTLMKSDCVRFRKNKIEKLIAKQVDSENINEVVEEFRFLSVQGNTMVFLKGFLESVKIIKNLSSEKYLQHKKKLTDLFLGHVETSTDYLSVQVSVGLAKELINEGLVEQEKVLQLKAIEDELEIARRKFFENGKIRWQEYEDIVSPDFNLFQLSNQEWVDLLGPQGVKDLLIGTLEEEFAIAKEFENRLLSLIAKN